MSVPQLAAALDEPAMKIHLAAGINSEGSDTGIANIAAAMKIHLAGRDPQHHAWAKHGIDKHNMKLHLATCRLINRRRRRLAKRLLNARHLT